MVPPMKTIILAAGLGNWLGTVTNTMPKALVQVAGIPLIIHVIRFARQLHTKDIVVVGGCKSDMLAEALGNEDITYVENPDYRLGNLYSLNCARPYMKHGFIQLNTDHLFPSRVATLLGNVDGGIHLVSDFDRRLFDDDMKIRIGPCHNEQDGITAISKKLRQFDGGYCGITVAKDEGVTPYFSALDRVFGRNDPQAVVEDVMTELIADGICPTIADISGVRWLEVDTAEELANARRILRMVPAFLE